VAARVVQVGDFLGFRVEDGPQVVTVGADEATRIREEAGMDADWLAQLAVSGATTLIGAAATDAWDQAREGFVRLLGRGDTDREAVAGRRLDQLTATVAQAEADERDAVREQQLPAWRTRLADLLEEDPRSAEPLRDLRDRLAKELPAPQQQWVQNITATAAGAVAMGAMFGNVNYHAAPAAPEQLPR
jgi:hypothetical protein